MCLRTNQRRVEMWERKSKHLAVFLGAHGRTGLTLCSSSSSSSSSSVQGLKFRLDQSFRRGKTKNKKKSLRRNMNSAARAKLFKYSEKKCAEMRREVFGATGRTRCGVCAGRESSLQRLSAHVFYQWRVKVTAERRLALELFQCGMLRRLRDALLLSPPSPQWLPPLFGPPPPPLPAFPPPPTAIPPSSPPPLPPHFAW